MHTLHETLSWLASLSTTNQLLLVLIFFLFAIWVRLGTIHATMRYERTQAWKYTRHHAPSVMRQLVPVDVDNDNHQHRLFVEEVAANSMPYDFGRQEAKTYEATKHVSDPES